MPPEAGFAPATALDAELFYQVHRARFAVPERRTLRHILVTFDNDAEKQAAQALLNDLLARLVTAEDFAAAALRHSHCPTALEGGRIGTVPRGKLYPELDAIAFTLGAGELSGPVETEIGLHLLRCDEIHPEGELPFAAVCKRIMDAIDQSRRKSALKAGLSHLPQPSL